MIRPMVAARGNGLSAGVRVLVGCCSFPVLDSMASDTVAVGSNVLVNGSSCRCATLFACRTCFNPASFGSGGGSNEETVRRVRINDNNIASLIAASNVDRGRAKTCAIRWRVKALQHCFAHVNCPKGTHRHTAVIADQPGSLTRHSTRFSIEQEECRVEMEVVGHGAG